MSIASEITRIKNNIASAYTALSDRGATLPEVQDSANLVTTVESIPSGETITVIGYYNFATYGSPNVDRMTGTVTNFSASNYLTVGNIDLTTADSWEAVSCFSISNTGKYQFWYYHPLAIGLDSSNHLHIWGLPDGDAYSNVTFGTNTTYWVKVEFTGTQYNAYRKSLKDSEWEQIISINSSNKVTTTTTPTYIGLNPNNTAEYFYGYIDLSECYIKVDDVVVWSPSGLPSSFIVGSLTENDKKLSGFSESNYVDTNYKYSVTSFDRVDIQVHFKTPATAFSSYENLIMLTSSWFKGINIAVMPNNSGFMFMYQSEQALIYTTLQTDTEYWVKFSSQGNGLIRLYYSTDGNTWATGGYDCIFNAFQSDLPVRVGKLEGNPAKSFEGQIYRDGTLIKINDNIVWSLTPVEEGNNGGSILHYDGLNVKYSTGGFITINGGALSDYSSVEGTTGCLQEKASEYNNIVQIGEVSVIKETGVVSNFSTSSYLKIPNKFTSIFNSWTRQICFTTGNDISTVQFLISDYDYDGVVFGISEGKLIWYASSDGGSWDILNGVTGITNLSANTKYWARLVFDGNIYKCYLSTTGAFSGEETTEISVTTFMRIKANCDTFLGCQIMSGSNYLPFLGSISLSDTYIMIDNDSWWTPLGDKKYTVTTDLYNNFTVIGTPVTNEISGVCTGFSSSDYLQTTYQFSATQSQLANGLIVQAHIRTPKTNVSRPEWVFGNNAGWDKSVGLLLNNRNVIQGIIADDNSIADNITGGFNLEPDTEYWIRIYKPDNSSVAMLQLSYDGINWLTDRRGEVETYNDLSTTTTTTFGTTGEQPFSGTIYLDDTFIEVGGVKVYSPVSSGTIQLSGLLAEGVSTQASLYNVFYNSDNGFIMDTTSTKQGYSWCGSVEVSI